jgi:hypothetical protein
MSKPIIRDFIYLDVERIRSFVAQAKGGLTSEVKSETQQGGGVKGSGKAKVPFLLEGGAEADYHLFKTSSETKSLHDHLFDEFYEALLADTRTDRVLRLDDRDPDEWVESAFSDGSFVLTSGLFKILDYKFAAESIQNMPKNYETVVKLFSSLARSNTSGTKSQEELAKEQKERTERQKLMDTVKTMPIKEIVNFTEQFYGDLVRVKVFPYRGELSKLFVGIARKELFRYSAPTLVSWYGPTIDADWSCVLQINRGSEHPPVAVAGATGNVFDDKFEAVIDTFTSMTALHQKVTFPAVAVTPIAIFREV